MSLEVWEVKEKGDIRGNSLAVVHCLSGTSQTGLRHQQGKPRRSYGGGGKKDGSAQVLLGETGAPKDRHVHSSREVQAPVSQRSQTPGSLVQELPRIRKIEGCHSRTTPSLGRTLRLDSEGGRSLRKLEVIPEGQQPDQPTTAPHDVKSADEARRVHHDVQPAGGTGLTTHTHTQSHATSRFKLPLTCRGFTPCWSLSLKRWPTSTAIARRTTRRPPPGLRGNNDAGSPAPSSTVQVPTPHTAGVETRPR